MDEKTIKDVWNELTNKQKETLESIIGKVSIITNELTEEQRDALYFMVNKALYG